MNPEYVSEMAAIAGEETKEVFPGDTPWRRRFVELVQQHSIAECGPYLKDGESPASCIARNRADVHSMLTLLANEKKRCEALREALAWYAESSNYRRAVRDVGPRVTWIKPPVAFDRGARAMFVLMTLEGTK